jgi:F0F1-type ATP synthase assembly protein I
MTSIVAQEEFLMSSPVLRQLTPYLNLGGTLAGCIVIGMLLGRWLDSELKTDPWFLLGGSLFGIASGFYHFFKVVLKGTKKGQTEVDDGDS